MVPCIHTNENIKKNCSSFSSMQTSTRSLIHSAACRRINRTDTKRSSRLGTCCCCGGEGVSISGLLEAVAAAASGNNPGAVEKKKQTQHQLLLVQELLRKWVTKGNVLEREWGDGLRERERERERSDGREEGGRREGEDAGAVQCSWGVHYERHLPHKGNRQGCR